MNSTATPSSAFASQREFVVWTPQTITRHRQPGADFAIVHRLGLDELHITIQPEPDDTIAMLVLRLDAILCEHEAVVARMEVFGSRAARPEFLSSMWRLMGEPAWPVMWIDGAGLEGNPIAGLHVFAVAGVNAEPVSVGGRIVGRMFSDFFARHCLLGDIIPRSKRASRAEQTREVFETMQSALRVAGMRVNDIARTWHYLDRLPDWYGDFDRVRAQIYRHGGIFDSGVPASTGIGARNPHGVALVAGAWAVVPTSEAMCVRPVRSPLQFPSDEHGASFARAMEWNTPGHRRISVSGTASIALGGMSVHKGCIDAQVELTMDVVEAILVSRGLDFSDVTRATAYVKHPRHAGVLDDWFERQGVWFPAVITRADVCRDELLFEVELDAILEKPTRRVA
jgi:enamine deaminase RidA (YjgF/YER057c/UK114 family)